jgi:hypothetical protein
MILTGFLDLECLINMISGRRYGIKNIKNYKRRIEVVVAPFSKRRRSGERAKGNQERFGEKGSFMHD